jgi:hypothetical protein
MRQTMPHVYKMSKHPKDRRYIYIKKDNQKKWSKSEMHTKCFENV